MFIVLESIHSVQQFGIFIDNICNFGFHFRPVNFYQREIDLVSSDFKLKLGT